MPPLPPDLLELAQARALWARHDLYGALAAFQQAVKSNPQHPRALLEAAQALGELYQFPPAEALLQRLVTLAADEGPLLLAAGRVYQHLRRTPQAETCFRAALAAKRPAIEARHPLAELFERQNQLAEAADQLAALVAELPGHLAGRLLLARVQRRQSFAEFRSAFQPSTVWSVHLGTREHEPCLIRWPTSRNLPLPASAGGAANARPRYKPLIVR